MEKNMVFPLEMSHQSNPSSIRDSNFKKDISLDLISKAPENQQSIDYDDDIKENMLLCKNQKGKKQPKFEKNQNITLPGAHRELFILQRKYTSNLKQEIQQIQEKLKLLTFSILQNDLKETKKQYLETQIQVRRLRIISRKYDRKNHLTPIVNEEYFPKSSYRKQNSSHRKRFGSKKKFDLMRTQGTSVTCSSKSLKNGVSFAWCQFRNIFQERKRILQTKKQIVKNQIFLYKKNENEKLDLLRKEVSIMRQQCDSIKKTSWILSSQISKLTNSFVESEVTGQYYVMSPKKSVKWRQNESKKQDYNSMQEKVDERVKIRKKSFSTLDA